MCTGITGRGSGEDTDPEDDLKRKGSWLNWVGMVQSIE